jgi:hypothetical protein
MPSHRQDENIGPIGYRALHAPEFLRPVSVLRRWLRRGKIPKQRLGMDSARSRRRRHHHGGCHQPKPPWIQAWLLRPPRIQASLPGLLNGTSNRINFRKSHQSDLSRPPDVREAFPLQSVGYTANRCHRHASRIPACCRRWFVRGRAPAVSTNGAPPYQPGATRHGSSGATPRRHPSLEHCPGMALEGQRPGVIPDWGIAPGNGSKAIFERQRRSPSGMRRMSRRAA